MTSRTCAKFRPRGIVYLTKHDEFNIYRIGATFNKSVNRLLAQGSILRIFMSRNPKRNHKQFLNVFSEVFEVSYKGPDYFIGTRDAVLMMFDDVMRDLIRTNQGRWFGKSRLMVEFPIFRDDISFFGKKRLFKILNKDVRFIERSTMITKRIHNYHTKDCQKGVLDDLIKNNIIIRGCTYDIANRSLCDRIDARKAKIMLLDADFKIRDWIEKFNNSRSQREYGTEHRIKNMLFKNCIVTTKDSGKKIYCNMEYIDSDTIQIHFDTIGMWGSGMYYQEFSLIVDKYGTSKIVESTSNTESIIKYDSSANKMNEKIDKVDDFVNDLCDALSQTLRIS